jgi:methionyl-tRNA formyltransferase
VSINTPLRIGFASTPDFGIPALNALISGGFAPLFVLTQPDRPAGRGRKLQASPVKQVALEVGIPVHQPVSLKDSETRIWLENQQLDILIVVAYGLILPAEILSQPRFGCWNIHASLLPRWRGAAPIQRAIEAGDEITGVGIMQMDEGLDTGSVILSKSVAIHEDETGGSLHDRLAHSGAESLLECLSLLQSGEIPQAEPQALQGITYARKLHKAEAEIDWTLSAMNIERKVRAFNPWPVCWCNIGGERTRIWAARAITGNHDHSPGDVVSGNSPCIDISTGNGILRLQQLQRPGGRMIEAKQYLNARQLPASLMTDD